MSNTAVYMVTHDNVDVAAKTIRLLRQFNDTEFDLFVADSGSGPVMQRALQGLASDGLITWLTLFPENVGQNIGANACLDEIFDRGGYDWVVCWSPDVHPVTRRALKKLIRAARMFKIAGASVIASPKVSSSVKPVPLTATGDDVGFPYHVCESLKGYARIIPAQFFSDWRFNVYGALSYGEAGEIVDRANALGYSLVTVENIKAKHVGGDPDFFASHIGYGL